MPIQITRLILCLPAVLLCGACMAQPDGAPGSAGPGAVPSATAPSAIKQSDINTDATTEARGRAAAAVAARKTPLPSPVAEATQTLRRLPESDGGTILADMPAPFPAAEFSSGNVWLGLLDGRRVAVFAGAADGAGQVRLVPVRADGALQMDALKIFNAPAGAGPLRIIRAQGNVLALRDAAGTQTLFDLSNETFAGNN